MHNCSVCGVKTRFMVPVSGHGLDACCKPCRIWYNHYSKQFAWWMDAAQKFSPNGEKK